MRKNSYDLIDKIQKDLDKQKLFLTGFFHQESKEFAYIHKKTGLLHSSLLSIFVGVALGLKIN